MCKRYTKDILNICERYAKYMPKICEIYAKYMLKICQRYFKDMANIWQIYAKDMPNICKIYARGNSEAANSWQLPKAKIAKDMLGVILRQQICLKIHTKDADTNYQ